MNKLGTGNWGVALRLLLAALKASRSVIREQGSRARGCKGEEQMTIDK
jgi:hypothetical protein